MMGPQRDQRRNQKIPWKKWSWEPNNPKPVAQRESSPEWEIHSVTSLSQKTRKSSNMQSNCTLNGTWKRTINKAQSEWKKGNNKDQSRNK